MRTLATCLALIVSTGFLTARDEEWVEFKSQDGKLSVKMPSNPKDISRDIDIGVGADKVTAHIFASEAGATGAFLVSWTDFPESLLDQNNITRHIDGVQNGVVGKGKTIRTKEITVQKKYKGRDVVYTVPNIKGTGKVRIFFVGNRLYQIMALGDKKFMESDDIDMFFNSFKLTR